MLPFTHAQFIEVFARYNANVWPAQVVAYLLALAMLVSILSPWKAKGRWVAAGLALMWLWTGVAYHGVHFSSINKAAYLFGALFVIQALLLVRAALTDGLRFAPSGTAKSWLGWSWWPTQPSSIRCWACGLAFARLNCRCSASRRARSRSSRSVSSCWRAAGVAMAAGGAGALGIDRRQRGVPASRAAGLDAACQRLFGDAAASPR